MWQMYHHSVTGFIHNSALVCLFLWVCGDRKERECVCVMCQGQETYGGRQSEAAVRVQPGHVSAVMEDIFYTWTLNTSLSDALSVDVRLLPASVCVWKCVCAPCTGVFGLRGMGIKDDSCRPQTDVFLSEGGGVHRHVPDCDVNHTHHIAHRGSSEEKL